MAYIQQQHHLSPEKKRFLRVFAVAGLYNLVTSYLQLLLINSPFFNYSPCSA